MAVIGALATLFVVLRGLAWVDGRHNQKNDVTVLAAEMKQLDEKVQSTVQRLDYIDLIQAVSIRDKICEMAERDHGLKPECEKAKAQVDQIKSRLK